MTLHDIIDFPSGSRSRHLQHFPLHNLFNALGYLKTAHLSRYCPRLNILLAQ
jgi:hypothetical protein